MTGSRATGTRSLRAERSETEPPPDAAFGKDAPMASAWDDVQVTAIVGQPGRFRAHLSDQWMLVVVPQGGVVAAIATRAMEAALDDHASGCAR